MWAVWSRGRVLALGLVLAVLLFVRRLRSELGALRSLLEASDNKLRSERAGRTRAEAKLRQEAQSSCRSGSDTPQPIQAIGCVR